MFPRSSVALVLFFIAVTPAAEPNKPVQLEKGVHLLLDDHFISRSEGIERKIESPQRFLSEPVVGTGLNHQNWQPFLTVLHDADRPAEKRFRMWYNVDVVDDPADGAFFGVTGHLESADGIHWPGSYERLDSLTTDGRVRFGASVLDEGHQCAIPSQRYKMLYFDAGKQVGPRAAHSADGLKWTLFDDGKPIIPTANGDDIWSAGYDPLRKRYFLIGKTFGPHTWVNVEGKKITASIRRYFACTSSDFKTWSKPEIIFSPDDRDSGITQWYGPAGFITRGDLIVGFLRVLRDDLTPEGAPPEAVAANTKGSAGLGASGLGNSGGSGMGFTVLTWTRDGRTWHRDRETHKFFEPDPHVGAWDHAMAWVGSTVPLNDEVYLFYAGYRWGHKYRHSVDRQLGLVKVKRDRFVARQAGKNGGTITTPFLRLDAETLSLNVDANEGEVRAQISNGNGEAIPGFSFQDCQPIASDSLEAPLKWEKPLSTLRGQTIRLELHLKNARLFAFSVN